MNKFEYSYAAVSLCSILIIQVTRSQLCNLLDVVEEVQLARFEIVNLSQTSFHTPSGNKYILIMSIDMLTELSFTELLRALFSTL